VNLGRAAMLVTLSLALAGCMAVDRFSSPLAAPVPASVAPVEPSVGSVQQIRPESDLAGEALARLDRRIAHYPQDYEAMLLKGLVYYESRQYEKALAALDELARRAPGFQLAQMIRGDMLLSRVEPVTGIGHTPLLHAMPDSRYILVEDLRDEARARLQAYLQSRNGHELPGELLRLGESVGAAILVDKRVNRLYLFGNTGAGSPPELLYDFYVSTGRARGDKRVRGDLRTPEGVYFVTRYTPDSRLPEKYGVAAFPINYPNELDRYLRKTGGGIWLHGITHRFYSRPPLDSEGCVVLSNTDLEQIIPLIEPKVTPVVIAERLEWLEPGVWSGRRKEIMRALRRWQHDWESGDAVRYLANYAPDFWADGYDFRSWSAHQRQVLAGGNGVRVTLSDISLLSYPHRADSGREIAVADFLLEYRSGDSVESHRKRLYFSKNLDRWYVLHESDLPQDGTTLAGSAETPAERRLRTGPAGG